MAAASAGSKKPSQPSQSSLLQAIKAQNVKAVHKLILQGVDTNYEYRASTTPLLTCLMYYNPEIFELLLKNGAEPNYDYPPTIPNPLHIAVLKNNLDAVKKLVEYGAELNNVYNPLRPTQLASSALTQAVENVNFEMVKFLVEAGADVNFMGIYENSNNNYESTNYESNYSNNSESNIVRDDGSVYGSVSEAEPVDNYANVWGISNAVLSKPHFFKTALERAIMTSAMVSKEKTEEIQKIIDYLLINGATYRESLGGLRRMKPSLRYPTNYSDLVPALAILSRKAAFNRRKHLLAVKNTRRLKNLSRRKQTRRHRW